MRARGLLVVLGIAACGDDILPIGPPLAPAENLTIVAHQDDDLLFMQPDLYDAVLSGTGVTNVYVTAGNRRDDEYQRTELRRLGLQAAYSSIAGSDEWSCGWIDLGGHALEHCRLEGAQLSLVFLNYPDGLIEGTGPASLLRLWQGEIASATTIGRRTTTYDRPQLIATLVSIFDQTAPRTLRTLEISATHGRDHSDHMLVGALALLANARAAAPAAITSFRGYNSVGLMPNIDPAAVARSLGALAYYEACAIGCAPCGDPCRVDDIGNNHLEYIQRRYAVTMQPFAAGTLRLAEPASASPRCLTAAANSNASLGDCATAPSWIFRQDGTLRTQMSADDVCLRVLATGEITAEDCTTIGPGMRFFLDEKGHLWSGMAPPFQAGMAYRHLFCVGASGGRPRAQLCGDADAPLWSVSAARAARSSP